MSSKPRPSENWNPADSGAALRARVNLLEDLKDKAFARVRKGEASTLDPTAEEAKEMADIWAAMKEARSVVPASWK